MAVVRSLNTSTRMQVSIQTHIPDSPGRCVAKGFSSTDPRGALVTGIMPLGLRFTSPFSVGSPWCRGFAVLFLSLHPRSAQANTVQVDLLNFDSGAQNYFRMAGPGSHLRAVSVYLELR